MIIRTLQLTEYYPYNLIVARADMKNCLTTPLHQRLIIRFQLSEHFSYPNTSRSTCLIVEVLLYFTWRNLYGAKLLWRCRKIIHKGKSNSLQVRMKKWLKDCFIKGVTCSTACHHAYVCKEVKVSIWDVKGDNKESESYKHTYRNIITS